MRINRDRSSLLWLHSDRKSVRESLIKAHQSLMLELEQLKVKTVAIPAGYVEE